MITSNRRLVIGLRLAFAAALAAITYVKTRRPTPEGYSPGVEVALHRHEALEVIRQQAPLATSLRHVEDRVRHLAQVGHARADRIRSKQERRDHRPFSIA
ncbi:exported hypothetical protein [Rhizobium sp. EC-SD404]|nr:exported hypothetical protein [Rhizobium sp. EC-SD404]